MGSHPMAGGLIRRGKSGHTHSGRTPWGERDADTEGRGPRREGGGDRRDGAIALRQRTSEPPPAKAARKSRPGQASEGARPDRRLDLRPPAPQVVENTFLLF